ncbi:DUF4397 domain-containing protein [Risungbinella massiliensis]|uniref:DUF4397 domain-containing protein n=1 Tax=Risungbinella massiliensis TaxID=1329796 RepID=UPI0005CC6FC1|nr:DUF4397 domain-containing protein [Risungbinella massiliensis]
MWQKYLDRAIRYKMLADYYRAKDDRKYKYYNEKYLRNQRRFAEEYERQKIGGGRSDLPSPSPEPREGGSTRSNGRLRMLHAYTATPSMVDVYVNNRLIAQRVPFAAITSYLRLPTGSYRMEVFPAGTKERAIVNQQLTVGANPYTLAVVDDVSGQTNKASLLTYEDDLQSVGARAKVRLIHLSPNAPRVDVAVKGGNVLFSNVGFTDARFISIPPGNYDLEIRITGTNQVIYTIPRVQLDARKIYSIFAVGRVRGNPAFRVLVVQDN